MRMFSQRIERETPELRDEGVRMRFIGRRERVAAALLRADGLGRARDRRRRPRSRSSSPSTTAAAPRSSTRRSATTAAARRRFAELLYAPEMHDPDLDHPHQRRAAPVELPALAVGLLRAGLPRRAVARLLAARRSRSAWASTRRAAGGSGGEPRQMREPRSRRRARRAGRRNTGSDLGRADLRRDAGDRVRDRHRRAGGLAWWPGSRCWASLPARALRDVRPCAPGAAAGFVGAIGLLLAAHSAAARSSCSCWCSVSR